MSLDMQLAHHEGLPVLSVIGELDWLSCPEFEQRVIEAAHLCDECVIVDLSEVTYVESSPLGVLIKVHVVLGQAGGDLAIVCSGSDVARIIKEFGIDHLLPVFDNCDAAAACLLPLRIATQ